MINSSSSLSLSRNNSISSSGENAGLIQSREVEENGGRGFNGSSVIKELKSFIGSPSNIGVKAKKSIQDIKNSLNRSRQNMESELTNSFSNQISERCDIQNLPNKIDILGAKIKSCEKELSSLDVEIRKEEKEIQELKEEIKELGGKVKGNADKKSMSVSSLFNFSGTPEDEMVKKQGMIKEKRGTLENLKKQRREVTTIMVGRKKEKELEELQASAKADTQVVSIA